MILCFPNLTDGDAGLGARCTLFWGPPQLMIVKAIAQPGAYPTFAWTSIRNCVQEIKAWIFGNVRTPLAWLALWRPR